MPSKEQIIHCQDKSLQSFLEALLESDDQILRGLFQILTCWGSAEWDAWPNRALSSCMEQVTWTYALCKTLFNQKSKNGGQVPPTLGTCSSSSCIESTGIEVILIQSFLHQHATTGSQRMMDCNYYCIKAPAHEALLALRKWNCKTHWTRQEVLLLLKISCLVQICVGVEMNAKIVFVICQRIGYRWGNLG